MQFKNFREKPVKFLEFPGKNYLLAGIFRENAMAIGSCQGKTVDYRGFSVAVPEGKGKNP